MVSQCCWASVPAVIYGIGVCGDPRGLGPVLRGRGGCQRGCRVIPVSFWKPVSLFTLPRVQNQ